MIRESGYHKLPVSNATFQTEENRGLIATGKNKTPLIAEMAS